LVPGSYKGGDLGKPLNFHSQTHGGGKTLLGGARESKGRGREGGTHGGDKQGGGDIINNTTLV